MAIPDFSMRQLLEAGVHFGHQTQRWNPRMSPYIYGARNGIHIIDLTQTVPLLDAALQAVRDTAAKGGQILFVGTKRQASEPIARAAEKSAQFYINHRWLGGTLTNWQTVSNSIKRLQNIDEAIEKGTEGLTKKERLGMEREQRKLQSSLGGIREMNGVPNMLFVIDVNKEALAVSEAKKLGVPIVAVVDTNCEPSGIDYIIPGNDDAARAIVLYTDLVARAALDGMSVHLDKTGVDLGEFERLPSEDLPAVIATDGEEPKAGEPQTEDKSDSTTNGTAAAASKRDESEAKPSESVNADNNDTDGTPSVPAAAAKTNPEITSTENIAKPDETGSEPSPKKAEMDAAKTDEQRAAADEGSGSLAAATEDSPIKPADEHEDTTEPTVDTTDQASKKETAA